MATQEMTIEQAKQKIKATLRGLRDFEKYLKKNPGTSPTRQFGEDYEAVYCCIFNKMPDLKSALPPKVTYLTNRRDGPPEQPYLEFLCWYEQFVELLGIKD